MQQDANSGTFTPFGGGPLTTVGQHFAQLLGQPLRSSLIAPVPHRLFSIGTAGYPRLPLVEVGPIVSP